MYEQYTDKQIVEMLKPKLNKATGHDWNDLFEYPKVCADMIKAISLAYRSGYVRGQLGRSFIIGEKKTKEPATTFEVGDKVKFLGLNIDDGMTNKRFYPPVNTVGKVVELGSDYCFVQWPNGSTSGNEVWACPNRYLEKITGHWFPATKDNVKAGSKVKMIEEEAHYRNPCFFPTAGTEGVAKAFRPGICKVQWPKDTTVGNDRWLCPYEFLEVLLCE